MGSLDNDSGACGLGQNTSNARCKREWLLLACYTILHTRSAPHTRIAWIERMRRENGKRYVLTTPLVALATPYTPSQSTESNLSCDTGTPQTPYSVTEYSVIVLARETGG